MPKACPQHDLHCRGYVVAILFTWTELMPLHHVTQSLLD